jgi:hypothetical protein
MRSRASLRLVRLSSDKSKYNQNNWTGRVPNGADAGPAVVDPPINT